MDAQPENPTIGEILRSYPLRICVYGAITVALYQVVFLGVTRWGPVVMGSENGPLEIGQVVLAIIAAVLIFTAAARTRLGAISLTLGGALVAYAAARESDLWFETVFFDDAYKWFVGLPMLTLVVFTVAIHRKKLVSDLFWLLNQPASTIFAIAGIFLCAVCQTLDRPGLWGGLSASEEAAWTKAMIEEYAELFAYLLLAFAGVESVILSAKYSKNSAIDDQPSQPERERTERPRIAA